MGDSIAVVLARISVVLNARWNPGSPRISSQCRVVNRGVASKKPTRVMKLPPSSVRTGMTVSIASKVTTATKTKGLAFPRSLRPGLYSPVTVVYRRRVVSHRCTGMTINTTAMVNTPSADAGPYAGGSKNLMKSKIRVE